jgi:hypothetical protein
MFVASFATDPELLAQLCDRETVALREHNETNNFFHGGDLVPRHSLEKCHLSPWIKCYLSLRIIPLEIEKSGDHDDNGGGAG